MVLFKACLVSNQRVYVYYYMHMRTETVADADGDKHLQQLVRHQVERKELVGAYKVLPITLLCSKAEGAMGGR